MISVSVCVNGNCIMARSAVRITDEDELSDNATYKVDDGNIIFHNPDDGAVELAKKLLDCIKDVKE